MRQSDHTLGTFDLRQPWIRSLLWLGCIPLFPEYIAPFLAIASLFAAVRDAKRHHRRVRVGAAGKAMIAYLVFAAVQLIWATNRLFSLFTLVCWIAMLCMYLAMSTVLTSIRRIQTALFIFSTVVGMLGVLACVQFALVKVMGMGIQINTLWATVDAALAGIFSDSVQIGVLSERAAATFMNSNLYAQYMVMAMPAVAAYAFSGRRTASKIISRISLLLAAAGLIVSFSRGAYLALGAVVIVMCIANIRRLIPVVMVASSVLMLLPDAVYARFAAIGDSTDHTIIERFDLWGVGIQQFLKMPILGHGCGVWTTLGAITEAGYYNPHVHNLFVQLLVEGGVIGLVLFLLILWKLFRTGFELSIHAPVNRMYGAAVIAFCAGLCVCGLVDYPLFTPKTVSVLMFMLGLTDALGFSQVKRPFCTVAQALPFYGEIHSRLEAWVQKKTAPKDQREPKEESAKEEPEKAAL